VLVVGGWQDAAHAHAAKRIVPLRLASKLAQDLVRRFAKVGRYLDRQDTARAELPDQFGQQSAVIRQPVQDGIREQQVGTEAGPPGGDVGPLPVDGGQRTGGAGEHRRVAVDTDDLCRWPALGEQPGDVAGTAAEIDDAPRLRLAQPGEKIECRPQPGVGEPQVLRGIPAHLPAHHLRRSPAPNANREGCYSTLHGAGQRRLRSAAHVS
jgi:hypothetical protein